MDSADMVYFATRGEWREWLEANHAKSKGIWLIYYKKDSGKPRIPYDDAVEEALCFGWIDSTAKGIDEEKYAQKFTPRNPKSAWSELNVSRAEKLIKEGRMCEAGLSLYRASMAANRVIKDRDVTEPPGLVAALEKDAKAREFYNKLSPTQKKWFFLWINDAKREATREKRIKESVELLAQNRKLSDKWFNR